MRLSCPPRHAAASVLLLAAVAGLYACSEASVAPQPSDDQLLAKPGGGGGPKVDSVDPPSAPQGTTLVVTVEGSGYDETSTVTMLLDRKPTDKVRTISTKFVSDKILEAKIEIDADADINLYDVEVTANRGRKKGVGVESFAVTSGNPVTALVTDPESGAGIYSDGAGDAIYTPGDGVTTRVDLNIQCTREIRLALPSGPAPISILSGANIPVCNDPGWVFLRLADLTTMGSCSEGMCWDDYPSYETNRKGKVRSTGGFAHNLHFFFSVPDDALYNFVWTDGAITLEELLETEVKHVTASNAHLYRGGLFPICDALGQLGADGPVTQVDLDLCPQPKNPSPSDPPNVRVNFGLHLDVGVVEGDTWPE